MKKELKYPKIFLAGLLVTLGLQVAALLCLYVSFLPPTDGRFWGVITLSVPLVLAGNGVMLLIWLLWRKWLMALSPLLAIAVNTEYVLSNFQYSPRSEEQPELRVASLNVDSFLWSKNAPKTKRDVIAVCKREGFDVFSMQEFCVGYVEKYQEIPNIRLFEKELGFYAVNGERIAIVSRFPIVASEYRKFEDSGNDYMWADIVTPKDTVRVISVHLQTSGIAALRAQYQEKHDSEAPIHKMVSTLEKNYRLRSRQAEVMREIIDSTPHPVLLMGDFNDTPSSYTYRMMKGRMNDSFREAGNGFGATFRGILGVLRIDYIFYDDSFRCVGFRTLDDQLSDHKLVAADLCYR